MKNYKLKIKNYHNGQVALIVLLASSLVMVVGLTISRRTVSQVKIDTNLEQYKQAFNAAESGMDLALQTENSGTKVFDKTKVIYEMKNGEIKNGEEYAFAGSEVDLDISTQKPNSITIWTKNKSPFIVDYYDGIWTRYFYNDGISHDISPGYSGRYISIRLVGKSADTIMIKPNGAGIGPFQKIISTGYYGKENKGVKIVLSANVTFKIPSFLLEPVVAVGSISP